MHWMLWFCAVKWNTTWFMFSELFVFFLIFFVCFEYKFVVFILLLLVIIISHIDSVLCSFLLTFFFSFKEWLLNSNVFVHIWTQLLSTVQKMNRYAGEKMRSKQNIDLIGICLRCFMNVLAEKKNMFALLHLLLVSFTHHRSSRITVSWGHSLWCCNESRFSSVVSCDGDKKTSKSQMQILITVVARLLFGWLQFLW